MSCTTVRTQLDAPKLALRVKNTFLEIEEEQTDFVDRQRAHTTPEDHLPSLESLVDELSSDSDDEEETRIDSKSGQMIEHSALNPSVAGHYSRYESSDPTSSIYGESAADMVRPTLRIKNTFLDIQEEGNDDDRQRIRTAPERTLTSLRDELSSDSESEDEVITNLRGLAQDLGCGSSLSNNGAVQTMQGMTVPLAQDKGFDGCKSANLESDVAGVKGNVWMLSRTSRGSWRVQQALEAASTEKDRLEIGMELEGRVWEAAADLHANFVLQKMIVLMHSRSIQFIIDELSRFSGAASVVAKNRYGCRVIQRLLEYCTAAQVSGIIEDLLQDVPSNCHNRYSTFVMQCLLEHCTGCQYRRLIQILMYHVQDVCTDDHGCSVISKALTTGAREEQESLAILIGSTPGVFEQMKANQGGFGARLVLQLSNGFTVAETESDCVQEITCRALPPSEPQSTKPEARPRRRGGGGGALAQAEAEARDILVSLHAACGRRAPVRINKAMEKVAGTIFASPILPPTLIHEASQAYEQAAGILKSIVPGERKRATQLGYSVP